MHILLNFVSTKARNVEDIFRLPEPYASPLPPVRDVFNPPHHGPQMTPVQGQLIETFSKFGEQFSVSGHFSSVEFHKQIPLK